MHVPSSTFRKIRVNCVAYPKHGFVNADLKSWTWILTVWFSGMKIQESLLRHPIKSSRPGDSPTVDDVIHDHTCRDDALCNADRISKISRQ